MDVLRQFDIKVTGTYHYSFINYDFFLEYNNSKRILIGKIRLKKHPLARLKADQWLAMSYTQ